MVHAVVFLASEVRFTDGICEDDMSYGEHRVDRTVFVGVESCSYALWHDWPYYIVFGQHRARENAKSE
jgi:hypothetical protein